MDNEKAPKRKTISFNGVAPYSITPIILDDEKLHFLTSGEEIYLVNEHGSKEKEILNIRVPLTVRAGGPTTFPCSKFLVDDDNIYFFARYENLDNILFSSPEKDPYKIENKLYIYDAKTLEQKQAIDMGNRNVFGAYLYKGYILALDSTNGRIEILDKSGKSIDSINFENLEGYLIDNPDLKDLNLKKLFFSGANFLFDVDKFKEIYGEEILENSKIRDSVYDINTNTSYLAGDKNIIFVEKDGDIQGILYFKNKIITGIDIDSKTNSLLVRQEKDSWKAPRNVGEQYREYFELIPLEIIEQEMKKSMDYLRTMQIAKRALSISKGDFSKMAYLLDKSTEMGDSVYKFFDKEEHKTEIDSNIDNLEIGKKIVELSNGNFEVLSFLVNGAKNDEQFFVEALNEAFNLKHSPSARLDTEKIPEYIKKYCECEQARLKMNETKDKYDGQIMIIMKKAVKRSINRYMQLSEELHNIPEDSFWTGR